MTDGANYVYLVRCNFAGGPEAEQAWNTWYSGPKMADMLQMPMFLHGQRFRSIGLDQHVRYLAIWTLASPAAFETPRYRQRWGFAEWTDAVTDWSRDLVAPVTAAGWNGVSPAASVVVTAFADVVQQDVLPNAVWFQAVGLDQSWPWIAIEVISSSTTAPTTYPDGPVVWRTHYAPLDAGTTTSTPGEADL